jgi:hypothetical protein
MWIYKDSTWIYKDSVCQTFRAKAFCRELVCEGALLDTSNLIVSFR